MPSAGFGSGAYAGSRQGSALARGEHRNEKFRQGAGVGVGGELVFPEW